MRFAEVDLIRGLAVVGMVIFHTIFDLDYLGLSGLPPESFPVNILGKATAIAFVFLAGVSLHLSRSRQVLYGGRPVFIKYLRRGLLLIFLGLLITAATLIYPGDGYVVFGVLHLIGLSTILSYPLLLRPKACLLAAAMAISAGIYLESQPFHSLWLVWLGFVPCGFYSLDFFPVFPWFGVVLTGIWAGSIAYPGYCRAFSLPAVSSIWIAGKVCFLGRHSLAIYMAHQPLIFGAIWATLHAA